MKEFNVGDVVYSYSFSGFALVVGKDTGKDGRKLYSIKGDGSSDISVDGIWWLDNSVHIDPLQAEVMKANVVFQ